MSINYWATACDYKCGTYLNLLNSEYYEITKFNKEFNVQ